MAPAGAAPTYVGARLGRWHAPCGGLRSAPAWSGAL